MAQAYKDKSGGWFDEMKLVRLHQLQKHDGTMDLRQTLSRQLYGTEANSRTQGEPAMMTTLSRIVKVTPRLSEEEHVLTEMDLQTLRVLQPLLLAWDDLRWLGPVERVSKCLVNFDILVANFHPTVSPLQLYNTECQTKFPAMPGMRIRDSKTRNTEDNQGW